MRPPVQAAGCPRFPARLVAASLCALLAGMAQAQDVDLVRAASTAKQMIAAGEYRQAADFIGSMERGSPAVLESFDLTFLQGVAWQQMSVSSAENAPAREAAFANARSAYDRALGLRRDSIATLNNLAALNAAAGRDPDARRYYRSAVELAQQKNDSKLEAYALNYANYLRDRDGQEAILQAQIAVEAPKSGRESRELLADLYAKYQPARLLPFARSLLDEGETTKARLLAITGATNRDLTAETRRAWLTMLVLCLTRDAAVQLEFQPEPTLSGIQSIQGDDALTPGAQQLALAIREAPADSSKLAWWRNSRETLPAVEVSGRAAMRELLTTLGERAHQAELADPKSGDCYDRAARTYRAAIEFGDRGPDPEAFLGLVNMLADRKKTAELASLMERYGGELFTEKGDAYARGDWPLIYRLHVALGMAYASLGIYESKGYFDNALFQLTHAQDAAKRLNAGARQKGQPEKYALPPAAVRNLSDAYTATGKPESAAQLRLDYAETFQKLGRTREAAELLHALSAADVSALSPPQKVKYQALRVKAPHP